MKLQKSQEQDFSVYTEEVLPLLDKVKKAGNNQWVALCPSHDDHRQSLSVGSTSDGKALLHCHANCSYLDIISDLGLYKEPTQPVKKEIVAEHDYTDEQGELLYQVVKFFPKAFAQRRPDGNGGWIYNLKGVRRVLYRLPELVNSTEETIFVVEGEKDADNLVALGFVATTNSGGASKWIKDFNKFFKAKDVIVIPDNDAAGLEHAEVIAKNVYNVANSVRILKLEGLAPKEDVSDWIAKDPDASYETLKALVEKSEPVKYDESELEFDKELPHYLEGELAILGGIFREPKLIQKVLDANTLDDFYNPTTKAILKAILTSYKDREGTDIVTVAEVLRRQGKIDVVGGISYLKSIKEDVTDTLNFDSWINIVASKAQFRHYIKLADKLGRAAEREADDPKSIADSLAKEIYNLRNKNKKESFIQVSEPIYRIIDEVKNLEGGVVTGLPTGYTVLDEITSGLQKTDLIILAGRPSQGKTALAVNIAYNVSKTHNVAFFSLEMGKDQLIKRILCSEARVDSNNFKTNNLDKHDWERIGNTIPFMEESNLYINDTSAISTDELRNECYKFADVTGKLDLIVVDYLQLMRQKLRENRFQEVSEISRELKALAKELDVPVLALSQLSRAPEARTPPIPIMSDLRESGGIEQDADVVSFIYRPEYYNQLDDSVRGLAQVIVAKQRNGPTGTVDLAFLKNYTRFENLFKYEPHIKLTN